MIDLGAGPVVVLIPGVQGRWEWMRPTVEALARRCRVITFSLAGDPGSGRSFDERSGFDDLVRQVEDAIERVAPQPVTLCGVSFGGLVALACASRRPDRVAGLILASTPAPRWTPDPRVRGYLAAPRLLAPLFVARAPGRLAPEILAAFPTWRERLTFAIRHSARVVAAPFSPKRMAARVRLALAHDFRSDCRRLSVPTLVIIGEEALDRVVPVVHTLEYARAIRGARVLTLDRTGHIGTITRPDRFAGISAAFAAEQAAAFRKVRRVEA